MVNINHGLVKLSISIDEDAILLDQIWTQFWSSKPDELANTRPFIICKIIENCCEDEERLKVISLLTSSEQHSRGFIYSEIIKTCSNLTRTNKANQFCPSYKQLISIPEIDISDPAMQQFYSIGRQSNVRPINMIKAAGYACNNHELHAFICLSDKKLVKSCACKILLIVYDGYGDIEYEEFMKGIKEYRAVLN